MRLGVADPPSLNPFNRHRASKSAINCAAHQALAKDAADQSLVLLKNIGDEKALPWNTNGGVAVKKVAVIGRMAEAEGPMLGNYRGVPPEFTTVCAGLAAHVAVSACINGNARRKMHSKLVSNRQTTPGHRGCCPFNRLWHAIPASSQR